MSVKKCIEQKLTNELAPELLEVLDESRNHNVPDGAESHFKVTAVSNKFSGCTRVKRHQLVYGILSEEMAGSVHALALHLYTSDEWNEVKSSPDSPQCLGGSKGE